MHEGGLKGGREGTFDFASLLLGIEATEYESALRADDIAKRYINRLVKCNCRLLEKMSSHIADRSLQKDVNKILFSWIECNICKQGPCMIMIRMSG